MTNLTVFQIVTDKPFTPQNEYRINRGKHSFKLNCVKKSQYGWYFSTEKNVEELEKFFNGGPINANLPSDSGVLKTAELTMKLLSYTETRPSDSEWVSVSDTPKSMYLSNDNCDSCESENAE